MYKNLSLEKIITDVHVVIEFRVGVKHGSTVIILVGFKFY